MTAQDLILPWTIAAVVGVVLLARGRLTLFHPAALYLGFHIVAFCVRPTLLVASGSGATWEHLLASPDPEYLRRALWVSSAGLVAFTAGFLAATLRAGRWPDTGPAELDACDERALWVTAGLLAPVAGIGAVYGLTAAGHSAYLVDLQLLFVPVALLALLAANWRWWSWMPIAALVVVRASNGPMAATVAGASLLILLLWLWQHQRRWPSALLVAASVAAMAVAVMISDGTSPLRTWVGRPETPSAAAATGPGVVDRFDRPAWAHLEALGGVIAVVPEKTGAFFHGRQHLRAEGTAAHELARHGRFRGLPWAIVSDGWMSGGWAGVAVSLALAGGLLGATFRILQRQPASAAAACFFLPVHVLALGFYGGASAAIVHQALYLAVPLLVWRQLANRFRRGDAAREERERLREDRQRRRLLGIAMLNPDAAELSPEAIAGARADAAETPDTSPAPEPRPKTPTGVPAPRAPARWRESGSD